ncbi:hypothetical protein M501DRAFT_995262 [Patellaria atrata CBS 101060]|uniref:WD40 repeat-like protein n=1 Tax=Patellaria atrata CBS 101060 TaxID=1346257 RepID=A0A9P4SAE4_9PEZI|nr:hypothetical protein M501DRAFT_995262 [Patellaria atrata CBS 101060]
MILITLAPSTAFAVDTLPSSSNLLHISIEPIHLRDTDSVELSLFATTADRRINMVKLDSGSFDLINSHLQTNDSPVLSSFVLRSRYLITASMSGKVTLFDLLRKEKLVVRQDHSKYVVQLAHWEGGNDIFLATAGWDKKILIYRLELATGGKPSLGAPIGAANLPTNPESIIFAEHPDSTLPVLLASRKDSTHLYFFLVPSSTSDVLASPLPLQMLGKQNLAPHSNAWISFTPSSVALSPIDSSLIAIATSAVPHMKLIIARLLLPPLPSFEASAAIQPELSQASQVRTALALQEREAAAILINVTTLSPQTQYSTPALAWRPDGSGIWVNSDDGVIRGIETGTGKVVATLRGHEAGSKIRCLWAGMVGEEEWLVSGGFDRKLIVWRETKA